LDISELKKLSEVKLLSKMVVSLQSFGGVVSVIMCLVGLGIVSKETPEARVQLGLQSQAIMTVKLC
jgi:hypothetical protein